MSTELPNRAISRKKGGYVTIVAATYNQKFTDALVENCLAELREAAPSVDVEVVRVPGAFEVPMMVRRAIVQPVRDEAPQAVIALGVILRGSTAHADLIGSAITDKLLSVSCETLVPVVHEVLLLNDEQQAFARCIAASLNRGREAARAAVAMMDVIDEQQSQLRLKQRQNRINPMGSMF